jgi:3-oxoacyl-[acyl-carrier-protein] synthase II
MSDSIVITGLGTVGPHGVGAKALAAALDEGRTAFTPIELSSDFHRSGSARLAGRVDLAALVPWLERDKARRMSAPSRMAVAAARLALEDAAIERASLHGRDVAVCLGTGFGPNEFTARILDQLRETGPESVSPFLFMESVANAHAGQVALDSGLRGANATIVQREASGLLALAQGLTYLSDPRCELALVGVVDEMGPLTHAMLDRFGALSRGGPFGECGRAFDAERNGFVASEGATVLVLEREERARARNAPIRARVRAALRANDPSASATSWGRGHAELAFALRKGLARHGLESRGIERVVSGASGSRAGDRLEGRVLRQLFGAQLPPVLVPKACTGEYGGGFLAAAVLALSDLAFGPTPGFEVLDPELEIRPHDGRRLSSARAVLVTSLAAGGAAAWLVLERV